MYAILSSSKVLPCKHLHLQIKLAARYAVIHTIKRIHQAFDVQFVGIYKELPYAIVNLPRTICANNELDVALC